VIVLKSTVEGYSKVRNFKAESGSAVRVATKGQYPEIVLKGFFKEENKPLMNEMMNGMGQIFLKCCATYEGNEAYIDKVVS